MGVAEPVLQLRQPLFPSAFWHLRLSELTGFLPTLCGRKWNVLQQCILYSVQVQSVMYRSQNQDVHDYGSWNSFLNASGEDVTATCKSWECVQSVAPRRSSNSSLKSPRTYQAWKPRVFCFLSGLIKCSNDFSLLTSAAIMHGSPGKTHVSFGEWR